MIVKVERLYHRRVYDGRLQQIHHVSYLELAKGDKYTIQDLLDVSSSYLPLLSSYLI